RGHIERRAKGEEEGSAHHSLPGNFEEPAMRVAAIDGDEIDEERDRHPVAAPAIDLPAAEIGQEAHEDAGERPANDGEYDIDDASPETLLDHPVPRFVDSLAEACRSDVSSAAHAGLLPDA